MPFTIIRNGNHSTMALVHIEVIFCLLAAFLNFLCLGLLLRIDGLLGFPLVTTLFQIVLLSLQALQGVRVGCLLGFDVDLLSLLLGGRAVAEMDVALGIHPFMDFRLGGTREEGKYHGEGLFDHIGHMCCWLMMAAIVARSGENENAILGVQGLEIIKIL